MHMKFENRLYPQVSYSDAPYTANPSKLNKIYFLILRLFFLKQENVSNFLRKIILIRKYSEK